MSEKVLLNVDDVNLDPEISTREWNGVELKVKNYLSLEEFADFVNSVVSSCYTAEEAYLPEVFAFAVDNALVEIYSNITLPDNNADKYKIIVGTNLVETIVDTIDSSGNRRQLEDATAAAKKKIGKINTDANNLLKKEIMDIYSTIDNFVTNLQSSLGDVDSGEIQQMIDLLLNAKLDEKKIVETIFDEKEKRITNES